MIQYIDIKSDNIFYLKKSPIVFFISENISTRHANEIDGLIEEILKMEYLTIFYSGLKNGCVDIKCIIADYMFLAISTDRRNFQIVYVGTRREYEEKKQYNYTGKDSFQVMINAGSAVVIHSKVRTSEKCGDYTDYSMDRKAFEELQNAIITYFYMGKHKENEKRLSVDQNFDRMILSPIREYTYCEQKVEESLAYGENFLIYERRDAATGKAKKKSIVFYIKGMDPDVQTYQAGTNVEIETNEWIDDKKRNLTGSISNKELYDEGIALTVFFYEQFDDAILPINGGRIHPKVNDIQTSVRRKVVKKIVDTSVPSQWMYSFFANYKLKNFQKDDSLGEFEKELNSSKYPPTSSQMEAIRKGIETEDLQLVLGPPGTGKTTVIVSWVKYFIGKGKRVLISSQNNAAVDNVLERVGNCAGAHAIRIGQYERIQDNCKKYSIEEQIDSEEKKYIETLECSQNSLEEDISVINNAIDEVERINAIYQEFDGVLTKLEIHRKNIFNLVLKVKETRITYDWKLGVYEELYDENVKNHIALTEISKYGKTKRFFLKHVIERMHVKEANDLEELKKSIVELEDAIKVYNASTSDLYAYMRSYEYVAWKDNFEGCIADFRGFSIKTNGYGRFNVKLPIDLERDQYGRYNSASLKEYFDNLKITKDKNEKVLKALRDWEEIVKKKRNEIISDLLIRNSNIVGATCIGINTRAKFQELDFDVSIIDESGQIQIHNVIVPMTRAPKTLMLGDHLQIPPIVGEEIKSVCEAEGVSTKLLEQSFFEFLFKKMEKACPEHLTRLKEQFRMPENISEVIAKKFYNGEYYAHYDMSKWAPVIKGTRTPLVFVSTSGEPNRFEQKATKSDSIPGYANPLEADIVTDIIKSIKNLGNEVSTDLIGVISAYGKQVQLIRKKISKCKLDLPEEQIRGMVASLDSFQGQERPLIIYSSTRSTSYKTPEKARVGFMKELRRLNVAFTRCKRQLVIVGDFDYLTTCEYEQKDEFGNIIEHGSEKEYSEFMVMMLDQVKDGKAELYSAKDFRKMLETR